MFEKIKVKSLAIFNTAVGTPSDVHPWHVLSEAGDAWDIFVKLGTLKAPHCSAKALSLFSTGRAELKTQLFLNVFDV